jgi:hypothetical protein
MRFSREGRVVYAKQTTLTVVDGKIASTDGPLLNPRVQVAEGASELRVDLEGHLYAKFSDGEKEVGRIAIALFPEDVRPVVDKGFLVSSYRPEIVDPGSKTAGLIRTGSTTAPTPNVTPTQQGVVEIKLKGEAEVSTAAFYLKDIAEVVADAQTRMRLETLEVSTTPALGATLRMSPEMVRLRLLRHSKEAEKFVFTGSTQVAVTRLGQEVTHQMFVDAALKAAREKFGTDVPVTCETSGPTIKVPMGKLELVGEDVKESGTRATVRVAILVDGERINSRTVTVDKADHLSKLAVGAVVKVLVRSSAAVVEISGRVRSIDRLSNSVVVETETGAELIGKVIGPNTIEVQL